MLSPLMKRREGLALIIMRRPHLPTYTRMIINASPSLLFIRGDSINIMCRPHLPTYTLGERHSACHSTTYKSAQRRYAAFCMRCGVANPYLLQEDTLCRYVAFLAKEGLRRRTIKSYLSGLRCLQIQRGLGNPFADSLPRLDYGIKQVEARGGSMPRTRLPITIDILQRLQEVWLSQPMWTEGTMFWAAACVGFFGFLQAQGSLRCHQQKRMTQTPT